MNLHLSRRVHTLLLSLGLAALCAAPGHAQDEPKTKDAPAASKADPTKELAKVGEKTITQGDVDNYVNEVMARRTQMMGGAMGGAQGAGQLKAFEAQLRGNAVTDLIRQNLVEAAIERATKDVPEAELTAHMAEIQAFLSQQGQDLEKMLAERGKSLDDLKGETRKQMALKQVMSKEVDLKAPTDEEIKAKFDQIDKQNLTMPERVRASHILIGFEGNPRDPNKKAPTDEEKAAKKKTAEEVLEKAKKGEDFAKLAEQYSSDPGSKAKGGDLDFFGKGMMTPNFEKAAFEAKPNTISDLVETEFGYHIIKVTDHKDTKTLGLDDIKFQLREQLYGERIQQKMPEFMTKLSEAAKVERLDGGKWPPDAPKPPSAKPAADAHAGESADEHAKH